MDLIWLYLLTAAVFLGLDMIGIRWLIGPVFSRYIKDLMATPPRLLPAGVFYLFYVAGVLWFVSWPAVTAEAPLQALAGGAILGAMCYGTYEITNYAILARWSVAQVALDLVWGTLLTAVSAWFGVAVMVGAFA